MTQAASYVVFILYNDKSEHLDFCYEAKTRRWFIDRAHAGVSDFYAGFAARHDGPEMSPSKEQIFEVFMTATSIELFVDKGSMVMIDIFFPSQDFNLLKSNVSKESRCEVFLLP